MASESHSLPHSLQQQLRKLDRKLYKAPGDDNFFTPQNDFFYSKTPYLPLDAKQKEIRLLKVFAPKPYANHIKDHPHWAPIDSVTGELIPVNDNSMPKILSSLQINGLHDLSTPILGCQIIDKVALSKTQAEWMYHAVSYCAGKPTDTTLILVDGLPFNAFANLDHAICKALKYWHSLNPGKELLLWADQICINQRDQAERASQVSLMREVYRRSSLTFICLSTVSTLTCLDWTFYENVGSEVDTFQQVFQKLVNTAITLTHSGGGVTIALSDCINPYKSAHIKSAHIESAQIKSEDSAILTKWLESVKSFTECQWFRRSWVQQEFFVAPRPIFISNNIGVPFNHLFKILEIIRSFSFNELLNLNIPNADTMSQALKDMRQLEDEIYAMTANWEDLVKINIQNHRSHSEDTVRQKLFDIAKAFHHLTNIDIHSKLSANISGSGSAFNFVGGYDILWDHIQARIHHLEEWLRRAAEGEATTTISIRAHRPSFEKYDFSAVSSVMGHKQSMRRTSDLRPLLEISRKLKASDPRDRVYAFLGLAHKEYGTLIPDYSPRKTVVHVLTDAAKAIIEIEKSLGVLEGVYRGRVNLGLYLPTWVRIHCI